jgi:hypothetical protein
MADYDEVLSEIESEVNRKINCKKGFVPKLLLMVRDLLHKMKKTYPN